MSHGFKYFTIADSEQAADPNSAAPPVPASYITASEFGPANFARDSATNKANGGPAYLYRDPIRTNTILAFKEKPEVDGRVYEAASVVHSMKERYGIESDAIEAPAATAEQGVTPLVAPEPPGKPVPVVATSQQPERPAESAVQLITGRVLGVTDGDTFTVRDDTGVRHKIHLASLDAPERLQAFWQGSKQALSGKLAGASVRVEWREKDRQGRLLGQVYLDDRWINREMIVEGWAWYHEPDSMNPDLAKAELAARAANAGLWSDPQPLAPWEFSGP